MGYRQYGQTGHSIGRERRMPIFFVPQKKMSCVHSCYFGGMDLALLKAPQSFEQGVKDINACSTGDVAEELVR